MRETLQKVCLILVLFFASIAGWAQNKNNAAAKPHLKKGNQLYMDKKFGEAQKQYLEALKKAPQSFTGLHNLGDALYQSEQYENARKAMEASVSSTTDKDKKAQAFHNIGNTYLKERNWEEAANAFKQSLKLNPTDQDTKYNLAYANAMLRQEGGGENNEQQNEDKKEQNKDQQNNDKQNKEQEEQNKGEQDKKQQQQNKDGQPDQPKEQQHQAPQPSKLSKQQAENLLNALMQEEKKLQDKKNEAAEGMPVQLEKDW